MLSREEVVGVATGRQVSHVTDQRERSGKDWEGRRLLGCVDPGCRLWTVVPSLLLSKLQ